MSVYTHLPYLIYISRPYETKSENRSTLSIIPTFFKLFKQCFHLSVSYYQNTINFIKIVKWIILILFSNSFKILNVLCVFFLQQFASFLRISIWCSVCVCFCFYVEVVVVEFQFCRRLYQNLFQGFQIFR